ncbi:MAG: dihydrofolate reductase [Clostridiales bacterium]|nr:dihydrofolate reductase [Clostridiales bacterium]
MNAIVVVDKNWGIGKEGNLLVHLPGDLKYYKEKTLGKVVVIGRKTLESFPGQKPLQGRTNLVITRDESYRAEGCILCNSKEDALERLKEFEDKDIFISGGESIYREFMDLCDTFYVTKIQEEFEADRYFPRLDDMGMEMVWQSEPCEDKGVTYRFCKYVREQL